MVTERTLPEALAQAARTNHGFTFAEGNAETAQSYSALLEASQRVARSLREAGLTRGDLVAIVVGDAPLFLSTLFGASIAGVIPASLYPPATTGDIERYLEFTGGILRAAGARAVVTTRALAGRFDGLRATCPDLEVILTREDLDAPPLDAEAPPSLDDIAFVQFTSGSTSVPKGVVLSHRNLCANVDAINGPAGLATSSDDVGVSWLPLYHDMGLVGMSLGPVYSARPAVLMTPQMFVKRPAVWLKTIGRHRGTVSFAPNFAYDLVVRRINDSDLDGLDLSCWRIAGCGAEPIHPPTLKAFAERLAPTGFRASSFFPSYGLAEHVLAATFPERGRPLRVETLSAKDLAERQTATLSADDAPSVAIVGCGRALPGHQIRIVDEDGRVLGDRQVGEITLAGPSVMVSYYRNDVLTAEAIRNGWLHTGDLGYLSQGELFVCGRVKDVIIVNGRKYHPQDLEWAVHDLPGVRRGRVVAFGTVGHGTPDRVVVVFESSGAAEPEAMADRIRRRVSDVIGLYVDEIVCVPSGVIGRTTSGKVQRAAMRARYERGALVTEQEGLRA